MWPRGPGFTLSGLDLSLMAYGLIKIGLVASNIYSTHDIIIMKPNHARISNNILEELAFLKCNYC